MFITAHTATDSSSFKASYLKGMWEGGGGFEGDLQLDLRTQGFEDVNSLQKLLHLQELEMVTRAERRIR